MRFLKRSEMADEGDGKGSVWMEAGRDNGYGFRYNWPLAHEGKDFDAWRFDTGFVLHTNPSGEMRVYFSSLGEAVKAGEMGYEAWLAQEPAEREYAEEVFANVPGPV